MALQQYTGTGGDWFTQNAPPSYRINAAPIPPAMGYAPSATTGQGIDERALSPTGTAISPSAGGGLPSGYNLTPSYGAGGYTLASFGAPGIAAPFTSAFNRPTPESIANDPSYKFQFQQGLDAIQRSAAAKGTLLTGGTLKGLTEFGQGLASTFDDKYWNRELGLYDRAYDIFRGNQAATSGLLSNLSSFGMQGAGGVAQAAQYGGQAAGSGTVNTANAINTGVANVANTIGEELARRRGQRGGFTQEAVDDVARQIYGRN